MPQTQVRRTLSSPGLGTARSGQAHRAVLTGEEVVPRGLPVVKGTLTKVVRDRVDAERGLHRAMHPGQQVLQRG